MLDRVVGSDGRSVKYNYGGYSTPNGTVYTYLGNVVYFGDTSITAIYSYQNDNVDPNGRPLIQWAIDPMYGGPMWAIGYTFVPGSSGGVYGQIQSENYLDPRTGSVGQVVSSLSINGNSRTETRGDGPSRTFNYSGGKLVNYTDFKNQTSYLSYDGNGYTSAFTDARGKTTTYSREGIIGAMSVLTHPDQSTQGYAYYYANGGPYHVQIRGDERGHNTYFTRDGNFQLTRIDYPDYPNGAYETFAYNGFGQVYSHRMTSGGVETRYIDGPGLMWASNNPDGTTYCYYDGNDRLELVTDPRSNTTWFQYNARGQVTRVTHMDGTYVQIGYDNHGDRISITDELNHTTSFAYDDYKRVVSATNPLNQTTSYVYAQDWSNSYNETTASVKGAFSPMGKAVHYAYDENWQRTIMRIPPGSDPNDAWTFYGYDPAGNLTWTQDPRNVVTTFGYDDRNRRTSLTNGLNQITTWQYDATNNLTRETRPDQSYRRAEYDSMNRVIDTYGFANEHTHYDRDLAGNVWQMIDAKNAVYSFGYDVMNRKTSATYPTDATNTNRTETWSYTTGGVLDYFINPAGQYQRFHFDTRNRLDHSWWDGGVGPNIVTGYDAASRLSSVTTNGGETTIAFGYDDANRKLWEEQTVAGYPTRRLETDHDADGNRAYLHFPGWYLIRYGYNQRNQLQHIYGGGWEPWFDYSYDAAGNMTKRQDVMAGVNDSLNIPSAQYDPLNRPVEWENTGGGDGPFARSWQQYDNLGRMTATWRDEQSSKGERFGYDAMGQLTSAAYNADQVWTGNAYNPTRTVSYSVDALNRQSVNENGAVTGYTPDALNQYTGVGGVGVTYDGNFNLTGYGTQATTFNAANQLTSLQNPGSGHSASFTYDGFGRCLKRTIDGATTLIGYDGWKPTVEWDGAGNFQAWNIYGAGAYEILWRYQGNYGHLRYHHDVHGNVAFILGYGGEGLEKYTYDAFGGPTITDWNGNVRSQSAYGNRFMFTGREYFSELGIYDYRNRFYHPTLGRFLQSDPIGFRGGDANLFRYCGGDPVNRRDPFGLHSPLPTKLNNGIQPGPGTTATTPGVVVIGTPVETANTAGMGPRGDLSPIDRIGSAPGEGSARDTGGGGGNEGPLYAQNARPPMSNRTVPVAPLPQEENELPDDEPDWPTVEDARRSSDAYIFFFKELFGGINDFFNWLLPGLPVSPGSPMPTPGPSSTPRDIPGPSPSGPPPPHG